MTEPKNENSGVASPKLNKVCSKSEVAYKIKEKDGITHIVPQKIKDVNQASDFWLSYEQVDTIIQSAKSIRDRTIIRLLYFGMLRRDEVRSLKIEDLNFVDKTLHLKITKRGKPRSVPIIQREIWSDLPLILGNRKIGWVFSSKTKDGRLSLKAINDIVGKTAVIAKIKNPNPKRKNMNPHILRHSYARFLRRQQPPIAIEVLQKLLGHASVKTTMDVYATADLEFIKAELERCKKVI